MVMINFDELKTDCERVKVLRRKHGQVIFCFYNTRAKLVQQRGNRQVSIVKSSLFYCIFIVIFIVVF